MKNRKPPRLWWREHFLDHPGFTTKNPDAYISSGTGGTTVTKLYCKLCFPVDINWVMEEDVHALTERRINAVQNEAQVEAYRESID